MFLAARCVSSGRSPSPAAVLCTSAVLSLSGSYGADGRCLEERCGAHTAQRPFGLGHRQPGSTSSASCSVVMALRCAESCSEMSVCPGGGLGLRVCLNWLKKKLQLL